MIRSLITGTFYVGKACGKLWIHGIYSANFDKGERSKSAENTYVLLRYVDPKHLHVFYMQPIHVLMEE